MVTKQVQKTFRSLVLIHHLYVSFYTLFCLEPPASKDEYVLKLFRFRARLFTTWNFTVQVIYIACIFIENMMSSQYGARFRKLRMFLLSTFVFPFTMFVFFMFWGLYHIDRELVLPKSLDPFWPSWLNHSVHTVVFFVAVAEIAIESQDKKLHGKSFTKTYLAMACLMACSISYDILFVNTFLQDDIWLYPVFGALHNWQLRLLLIAFSNLSVFGFHFLADYILNGRSEKKSLS